MRVILDANVLFGAYLRGYLLWLHVALAGKGVDFLFSEDILDEVFRNLTLRYPDLDERRLIRSRRDIETHFPSSLVDGYARHIAGLQLPDADDRHVLAAAIEAGAGYIVTFNIKHFPPEALGPHRVTVIHPDGFLCLLLDKYADEMTQALVLSCAQYKLPPNTPCDLLRVLDRSTKNDAHEIVPQFAARMRARLGCP